VQHHAPDRGGHQRHNPLVDSHRACYLRKLTETPRTENPMVGLCACRGVANSSAAGYEQRGYGNGLNGQVLNGAAAPLRRNSATIGVHAQIFQSNRKAFRPFLGRAFPP